MGQYKSQHTGPQIDAGVDAALNPDVTVTPDSDALVTSGAVADALDNIDPTITSTTDTTLNGILVGNGSKVGTKSLDTSSLTNDADHVPASSVVKSALDAKADKNDLATIHQTSPTCTEPNGIAAGVFFYLDNELVVAKTAIANGATFTNGTNYESPTAGGLNALKSALSTYTLLWTNQNPNSNFAAQTIPLNLSGYTFARIVYKVATESSSAKTVWDIPVGEFGIALNTYSAHVVRRSAAVTTSGIEFYVAVEETTPGDGSGNVQQTNFMIPYKIYGVK